MSKASETELTNELTNTAPSAGHDTEKGPQGSEYRQKSQVTLKQKIAVAIIAAQFGLDSSVYLSSTIQLITGIVGSQSASHWLFVTQAVLAAAETAISLIIGWMAYKLGTIKWLMVGLISLSAGGNFLYSCAGPNAIDSIGAVVGGRVMCGTASCSAALIYSYITAVVTGPEDTLELMKCFRTSAGLVLALGQIIAVGASHCDFYIGRYHIDNTNAPTFLASFIIFGVVCVLSILLENPDPMDSKVLVQVTNPFNSIQQLFRGDNDAVSVMLLLWTMFVSAYSISIISYFLPVFFSEQLSWSTDIQGTSFIVAAVVSIIASILYPKLFESVTRKMKRSFTEPGESASEKHLSLLARSSIVLFFGVGLAVLIIGCEQFAHHRLGITKSGIVFTVGMAITLTGYNVLGAALPVLFSYHVSPQVKVQMMPIMGAMVGLGKLIAPIISNAIYESPASTGMAIGFGIILGFLALLALTLVGQLARRQDKENV